MSKCRAKRISAARARRLRRGLILRPLALMIAFAFGSPRLAIALPEGAQVAAGSAAISRTSPQAMIVDQGSARAIINWQGFSIALPESVVFRQPSASSVLLNRVVGTQPSEIFGSLTANGQLFLVNPNGVLFGRGAMVDVGGLVASTLNISDQDFLGARYRFGGGGGAVSNAGTLRAADGGTIALLGAQVNNDGTIVARLGSAALAAGRRVTLDFAGDGLTRVTVDEAALGAQVNNRGAVLVDGGQALMTARAADAIVRSVVNQTGIVRATSLVERDGRIVLDAGDSGAVAVGGTLDASGPAAGARGGTVGVLGAEVVLGDSARIDVRGDSGGGGVQVGAGRADGGPTGSTTTRAVTMEAGARIAADALRNGAGGRVVLWSDGSTRVRGTIAAAGGAEGGDGGFVETSGRQLDIAGANVSAGAPRGAAGTWLLDPVDVVIDAPAAATIASALASTNVTVTTDVPPNTVDPGAPGDITVAAGIARTAGAGTTTLSLRAARDIVVGEGVGISSSAGPLNVELIARKDATNLDGTPGTVHMLSGSSIVTNGGNVLVSGGVDPFDAVNGRAAGEVSGGGDPTGVSLFEATIDTRRSTGTPGSITLRGRGGSINGDGSLIGVNGVDLTSATLRGGSISIDGVGGDGVSDSGGNGVALVGATISGRSVTIVGVGGNAEADPFGFFTAGGTGVSSCDCSGVPTEITADDVTITGVGGRVIAFVDAYGGYGGQGGRGVDMSWTNVNANTVAIDGTGGVGTDDVGATQFAVGGDGVAMFGVNIAASATVSVVGRGAAASAPAAGPLVASPTTIGADIQSSTLVAEDRVAVRGEAPTGTGTWIRSATEIAQPTMIRSTSPGGSVRLFGFGNDAAPANVGLRLGSFSGTDSVTVRSNAGDILIGGAGLTDGVRISAPASIENIGSPSGRIDIRGYSETTGGAAPALSIEAGATIGAAGNSGNIVLGAGGVAGNSGDLIEIGNGESSPTIRTSGAVIVAPLHFERDESRAVSDLAIDVGGPLRPGVPFNLAPFELDTLTAQTGALVVGGPSQRQAIAVRESMSVGSNLTLQQDGTSGLAAGIALDAPLSVPAHTLALVTGGALTQAAPVTAARLLLSSDTGPLAFTDPGNKVGRVAITAAGGDATFINGVALTIGSVSAKVAADDAGATATRVTNASHAQGDFLARTLAGNLTLLEDVSTGGSEITLVTDGVFLNAGNASLSPGGGDRWTVWANSWTGENRGGLVPSSPLPNIYGCVYGSGCVPGVVVPATGNHFVYALRPTLVFTTNSASRVYGDPNPPFSIVTISGLLSSRGDTLADAVSGSFTTSATQFSNVGIYPITGTFTSPAGYILSPQLAGLALTITPAQLAYVATPATRPYGSPNPPLSGTVTGLRNGETVATATSGTLTFTTPATQASSVGSYAINGGGLTANHGNYTFVQAPGNATALTITQALLTYLANAASREYGLANPPLSGTVTGFVGGDTLANATTGTLVFTSPATPASNVGSYAVIGGGLVATGGNYAFAQAPGNATALTITPALLTYLANPASREYGLANPPLSGTVSGLRNGETIATATTGVLAFTSPATPASNVGSYAIDGGGLIANHGNYTFAQAPGNASALTITPATLAYLADPLSREYGLANPPLTGGVTGLRAGDTLASATTGTLAFATPATPASNVGSYAIDGSGLSANHGNYTFVQAPGNATALTITPALLTYLANPASREYGLANPPLSGTVSGLRNGETLASATTGTPAFATPATPTSNVGSYAIDGGGLVANHGNYTFAQAPGNATALTITPAPLTYVADPAARFEGTPNPAFTGTLTGFRVGDTPASATTGTLQFASSATPDASIGRYPIEGSGLAARNYVLLQAPSNASALRVLPEPGRAPVVNNPRNPETEPTYTYDRNFGVPGMCTAATPLTTASGKAIGADLLEVEWSRVRSRPALTNCVDIGQRDFCKDF